MGLFPPGLSFSRMTAVRHLGGRVGVSNNYTMVGEACCLGSLPSHGKLQWRQRLPARTHLWADAIFCAARRWALATAFENPPSHSLFFFFSFLS